MHTDVCPSCRNCCADPWHSGERDDPVPTVHTSCRACGEPMVAFFDDDLPLCTDCTGGA